MKLNKLLTKIIPIIFLIGVCLVFLYKFILKGLLPLPLDIITGMYYPWLNHKWGNAVGVAVKNHFISDSVSQFWIWRNWAVNLLKQGKIGIWNPHSLAGYPLSPWFHTMIFSPINLVYFVFSEPMSMAIVVVSQLFVGLIGMYLMTKKIIGNQFSAVLSSILFVFSSFFIGWLTWGTVSWTLAFLPWILYFLEGNQDLGVFISLILSFLGGHPQTFLYVLIITGIYLIINNFWSQIRTIVFSLGAVSLAVLPSVQILMHSIRGKEDYLRGVNYGLLSWPKLIILGFAPNVFGNPATLNYWGKGFNFQESLVWFGTGGLILCLFYLSSSKKIPKLKPFIYIFLLGIILGTKYPFGILIYKLKLPFLSSASAGRALILSTFGGSILAGGGLKLLMDRKINWKEIRRILAVSIGIIVGLFVGLGYVWYVVNYQAAAVDRFVLSQLIVNVKVGARNLIIPIFSTLVVLGGIVIAKILPFKKIRFLIGAGLILLAAAEGLYFGWKYTPFTKRDYYFPKTEVIDYLTQQNNNEEFYRIERQQAELLPPNMWMAYGLNSTAGYQPVYPLSYAKWLRKEEIINDYSRYVEWDRPKNFFDEMGVKYYLVLKRNDQGEVTDQGNLPYWLDNEKWLTVKEEGPVVILENNDYNPPYYLRNNSGEVKLVEKANDYWLFKTLSSEENALVVKENYFPGWKAKIDGQPVKVNLEDGTFKQVDVPEGESKIEFYYQNSLLSVGVWMSLASILWFLFVIVRQKQ